MTPPLFDDGVPPNVPLCSVVTGDCRNVTRRWPGGWADLVFADPPFNVNYGYDVYDDNQERSAYLRWAADWTLGAVRLLRPHGTFVLAIGDEYAAEYKVMLTELGLTLRNWIIWHYTFGPHQKRKFGRDHSHLLYFTRHPTRFKFNADDVRVRSARQEQGDPRADPRGRVPGDVWTFPRLVPNAKERMGHHPCQMPESPVERLILATTDPGDVVFDPFVGSGTTLVVAKRLARLYLGTELSAEYARAARRRLSYTEVPDAH